MRATCGRRDCRDPAQILGSPSMNRHRFQTTTSLVLGTAVLIVIALIVLHRVPMSDTVHAQDSWRGLVVAPEQRCAPYDTDDYRYPQSVEDRIVAQLGGVYGPYTGRWFASDSETDIEHIVARSEAHDSGGSARRAAGRPLRSASGTADPAAPQLGLKLTCERTVVQRYPIGAVGFTPWANDGFLSSSRIKEQGRADSASEICARDTVG